MKTATVKLPAALDAQLVALARRRGASKSAIIRQLIADGLRATREARPGTVLARGRGLVGSLSGPGDLSTNPKHMEGFGE